MGVLPSSPGGEHFLGSPVCFLTGNQKNIWFLFFYILLSSPEAKAAFFMPFCLIV
jgi:hypothetical protein